MSISRATESKEPIVPSSSTDSVIFGKLTSKGPTPEVKAKAVATPSDCAWLSECKRSKEGILVNLKQLLDLIKNNKLNLRSLSNSSKSEGGGGARSESWEINLKDSSERIIFQIDIRRGVQDYFEDITLLDICQLSKSSPGFAVGLLNMYLKLSDVTFLNHDHFLESFSYQDLVTASHPAFLEYMMEELFNEFIQNPSADFLLTPKISSFLEEHTRSLVKEVKSIPSELLPIDFSKTIAASTYETQSEVEGYWVKDYSNSACFEFAKAHRKVGGIMSEEDLLTLRAMVLEKEHVNDGHRYPVPGKQWENQDKFLACLETLEKMSKNPDQIKRKEEILQNAFGCTQESLSKLLPLSVCRYTYRGYATLRLPLTAKFELTDGETMIRFPNPDEGGKLVTLAWTNALRGYVSEYNHIPSKQFLQRLGSFLKLCQSYYLDNAHCLDKLDVEAGIEKSFSASMRF